MRAFCFLLVMTLGFRLSAQDDIRIELNQQIETLYYNGDLEEAIEVAQKIIAISTQKDTLYTSALSNLAILYFSVGNDKQSTLYTQKALAETQKISGKASIQYANALGSAAYIYKNMGLYEEAKQKYIEALGLYEKIGGKEHPDYTTVMVNLANVYVSLAAYELGEQMYKEALKIDAKVFGKDHPNYIHSQSSLAYLYQETNRYEEAIALYKEILVTKRKILGENHVEYAITLNDLATAYKQMGLFENAKEGFEKSLKIIKATQGSGHPYYATILHNLASTYEELGAYELAKEQFEQVLALDKHSVGTEHPYYAQTLGNIANMHIKIGNYALAEANILGALSIFEAVYGRTHPDYVRYAAILGNCYIHQKKYKQAIVVLLKTLNPEYTVDNEDVMLELQKLITLDITPNVGNFYALTHLIEAATHWQEQGTKTAWLNLAFELNQKVMTMVIESKNKMLIEQGKLRMLKVGTETLERAIGLAKLLNSTQHWEATWQLLEQNKSVLLADALRTKDAKNFGDLPDSLALKEQQLQQTIVELKEAIYSSNDQTDKEALQAELNATNLTMDELTQLIANNYPKYYKLKYEQKQLSLKELQSRLDKETAVVEYFIGDTFKYAFVITAQEFKVYPLDFAKAVYEKYINQLRKGLTNYVWITANPEKAYVEYSNVAYQLYKMLLEQPLDDLKATKNLVIMPDHWLNHIPFEVLLTQESNQELGYTNLFYLLKEYTIAYSYSSTLWLENKKRTQHSEKTELLALAASYDLGIDSSWQAYRKPNAIKDRKSLKPLPFVKNEVEQLKALFAGKFIKDQSGTEANFKKWANNYGVLHLAMHGLLDQEYPILSALAFTEDGDSLEDNFLRAYEIAQLSIEASLVVLSACETGYGKFERGEGVMSLARSFMYAGAPSLVVSLWKVNDMATAKLMKYFYEGLDKGLDKAKALQAAKLAYLKNARGIAKHPAFWAAFILQGDQTAITIATKTNKIIIYGAVIVGGLLLFSLGLWKYIHSRKKSETL